MEKYYITEEAFEKIFMYLRSLKGVYCKKREKTRRFLEAVSFVMRTGAQWMELPRSYGNYKSIHKRFIAWTKKGVWNELLAHFAKECDAESFIIDGSVIRAHACASGYQKNGQEEQALGRSKEGFTTKIHALVDALGLPIRFILTPGQSK
jgi:transposase